MFVDAWKIMMITLLFIKATDVQQSGAVSLTSKAMAKVVWNLLANGTKCTDQAASALGCGT
jgi:hypothetical protein